MLRLDQNLNMLSAADRLLIDAEHARLEQFLCDLRDTCENFSTGGDCYSCSRAQVATCQGRLNSFFYDFLDLLVEHFENEENIMRNHLLTPEDESYFHLHQEEHARLIHEVRELMRESAVFSSQGNPSEAIRRLESKISELFGLHTDIFDSALLGVKTHRF